MQIRKTKIVCSLGPASSTDEIVRELVLSGMNVARLNFSHGSHESHREAIERVRRVSAELGTETAILLDTKGPEIRTGVVENGEQVTINDGDSVVVTFDGRATTAAEGDEPARVSISWKEAGSKLKPGHRILIADGLLDLEALEVSSEAIACRASNTATIGGRKNVNLIGVHAQLPIMSAQDAKDIAFGVEMDVDYIAASFVSFPHEITEIRRYLDSFGSRIKIIAKIENAEGLENIREIAKLSDGVMVARGDLGVQLPTEEIPLAQKHIINACRRVGKPVITATQMLESMIVNPRPTRAELTDVANAIFDGTDAIMLSGETASGAYPCEAVKMMDKIARAIERSEEFRARMMTTYADCFSWGHRATDNLGVTMAKAGVETASAAEAKAIVIPTLSGNSARILSVFRPNQPIFAMTSNTRAHRTMQLLWGVYPCYSPRVDDAEGMIQNAMRIAMETGIAEMSDKIVLVAGLPLGSPNMINTIRIILLGTVLLRAGAGGFANPATTYAQGKIVHAANAGDAQRKITAGSSEILVCKELTSEYMGVMQTVSAIICEGVSALSEERLREINPGLVWLTNASGAIEKLEQGIIVTVDASQLLVYEGSVMHGQ
ncbi:MAG: pyruvate kinase [Treponema sp.]|nr:pyruvate kinase [Treponema sp.]